ncbi:hypothetical protein D9Q98_002605 [Chlorella vulgaris]|uniref:RNase H type-1 domain-containing protein n=1 Tax=Chlorella vulgaris TaxID=3077 RepID=A0A9D4TTS9_CHLVU|nr:hypothetical protein D9Q98_002605 [Chlorella vulgaris]
MQDSTVAICKVRAHAGVRGNEMADAAAKAAGSAGHAGGTIAFDDALAGGVGLGASWPSVVARRRHAAEVENPLLLADWLGAPVKAQIRRAYQNRIVVEPASIMLGLLLEQRKPHCVITWCLASGGCYHLAQQFHIHSAPHGLRASTPDVLLIEGLPAGSACPAAGRPSYAVHLLEIFHTYDTNLGPQSLTWSRKTAQHAALVAQLTDSGWRSATQSAVGVTHSGLLTGNFLDVLTGQIRMGKRAADRLAVDLSRSAVQACIDLIAARKKARKALLGLPPPLPADLQPPPPAQPLQQALPPAHSAPANTPSRRRTAGPSAAISETYAFFDELCFAWAFQRHFTQRQAHAKAASSHSRSCIGQHATQGGGDITPANSGPSPFGAVGWGGGSGREWGVGGAAGNGVGFRAAGNGC